MSQPVRVKICGLRTADDVRVCCEAGAQYIGFNHFPKSPRYLPVDALAPLAEVATPGVMKVALVVDPDDALIDALAAAPIDMVQFHGAEPPERVAELRARLSLPVMKAIGIASAEDLPKIAQFAPVVDQLLIDAKAPKNADLPGGNGVPFDWRLIAGRRWPVPWLLAGGLTPDNVAEAVRLTGAPGLDLSSGVESAPGVKDPEMIRTFCAAAAKALG